MNILRSLLTSLNKSIKKIKLIDRCLIIFMIILMTESIYNLFSDKINPINSNDIDVVIRTTSAAIFGYFLSGNFMKRPRSNERNYSKENEILEVSNQNINYNEDIIKAEEEDNKKDLNINNQQIIIATIIGVIALIVLIIARNSINITGNATAIVSQMRDFVCGCVGFLLGCPTKVNK